MWYIIFTFQFFYNIFQFYFYYTEIKKKDLILIYNIIYLFLLLQRLQAAAGTKLAEIKEKSALGMQHIIEEHKRLELKIDMMPSYIVIPHGGFYRK